MTAIFVAILTCIGTVSGSLYGIRKSTSLVEYRLKQLEEKVLRLEEKTGCNKES